MLSVLFPISTLVSSSSAAETPVVMYGSSGNSTSDNDKGQSNDIRQAVETGLPVARKKSSSEVKSVTQKPQTYVPLPTNTKSSTAPARPTPVSPEAMRPVHSIYPWKTNIITTVFWIGEGASSYSSTDNKDSAWVEDWGASYSGNDNPEHRQGYLPAHHAATCNPFYVALPFNDLAFPDKARRWVPASWSHPTRPGEKPISACRGRWVEIKRANYPPCFAQWEDVGPVRYDHAEYVFGDERPTNMMTRAGLDISPAVAKYLGMDDDHTAITSWRFVEADDVPPGAWLVYEEQAILMAALQSISKRPAPIITEQSVTPRSSNNEESKKKISASKG